MTSAFSIPVINLQDYTTGTPAERERFISTLGDALRHVGFFALTGHDIAPTEVQHAYGAIATLFELPTAVKEQYEGVGSKGQRGYTSFGREHAKDSKAPDLKEFWHVGQELALENPRANEYPQNIWPPEVPKFKPIMLDLFFKLETCALMLLEACALYLGENVSHLRDMATDGNSILRLIHYPPIPADRDPNSIRAAAHEDINLITLLIEATDSGLEILGRDQRWVPVVTPKDCIIVDAGDMLQNLSNGYFRSTTHRVVNPNNERNRRLSMPFFVHARGDIRLDPLPSCVEKTGGAPVYPPITAGAYLHQRLTEIGLA